MVKKLHPALVGLEPANVLGYFSDFLGIRRESGNEDRIVQYIKDWADTLDFKYVEDGAKNLSVKIPATPGLENVPAVCIQNHTDMVVNDGDALDEPIDIQVKDGWVMTKGKDGKPYRTLGADNGIGVALAMEAVTALKTHGPIELLFTSDEEDGFTGCEKFKKKEHGLVSELLINNDTPHPGRITVASAGFRYVEPKLPLTREGKSGTRYQLSLKDMPGGHSGEDVHQFRGNALKLMGTILSRLPKGSRLVTVVGGEKGNSIPINCTAVVDIVGNPDGDADAWRATLTDIIVNARDTYRAPDITLDITYNDSPLQALTQACHDNIVSLLRSVPSGVVQMNLELEDLPDLSSTFSIIRMEGDDRLKMRHQVRGSTDDLRDGLTERLVKFYKKHGCHVDFGGSGRGWIQNREHPLVKATQRAFEQVGYPGMLSGNHGAIEPGTLCGDPAEPQFKAAVSFGVWIKEEHKPTERFPISELVRTRKILHTLITGIANGWLAA